MSRYRPPRFFKFSIRLIALTTNHHICAPVVKNLAKKRLGCSWDIYNLLHSYKYEEMFSKWDGSVSSFNFTTFFFQRNNDSFTMSSYTPGELSSFLCNSRSRTRLLKFYYPFIQPPKDPSSSVSTKTMSSYWLSTIKLDCSSWHTTSNLIYSRITS